MKLASTLGMAGLVLAIAAPMPALADREHGKGHGKSHARHVEDRDQHDDRRRQDRVVHVANCPPGLAKKNARCIPPGHAKHRDHRGKRVGDVLRSGDHVVIRDPRRYNLEDRRGWDYYRDDNAVYRVDSSTRKILAVLNLIDAFSN